MTDAAQPEEFTPENYVCKGRRLAHDDGKLYVVLAPIGDHDAGDESFALGDERQYELSKGTRRLMTGYRYSIPTKPGGSTIQAASAKMLGPFKSPNRANWQAETDAAEAEYELLQASKRAGDRDELLAALLPFRRTYQKTIGTARKTALELALLAALRTPPRSHER